MKIAVLGLKNTEYKVLCMYSTYNSTMDKNLSLKNKYLKNKDLSTKNLLTPLMIPT